MILRVNDWEFDIDMERTMAYSAAESAEHCNCAYCRNFYETVDVHCSQLRPFLAQFGLQIDAPDELMPYDVADRIWYEGKYAVFGKINVFGKDRIFLENVSIWPMKDASFTLEGAYFVLNLEDMDLPWALQEPLKDVISPANEPTFLKIMWDRLLGKMNNTPGS